jgi:DUF4097 and DUF4098 domain-containing protein YvlB
MKKLFLFLLLSATLISLRAQFDAEKTPLITQSLVNDNIKNVFAETSGGNITVIGVPAGEAKLEVYVVPNNYRKNPVSEEEIRSRMKEYYEIKFWAANNKLTATAKATERNMDWKKSLNFSYKIYVPRNVSVDLSTSGGNISLTDISGHLAFSTSGGNLNLEKIGGNIKGTTSGGNINLEDSKDTMNLETSGGNIHATRSNGKMKLITSGGSLTLSDLKGDIEARTSGGNVNGSDISGDLDAHTSGGNVMLNSLSCNLATSTSGGNIHIELKELHQFVKATNSGGYIDVIIPANKGADIKLSGDKIKMDETENFKGSIKSDEVTGKLGGGGTAITVDAGGGRVYLGFSKK